MGKPARNDRLHPWEQQGGESVDAFRMFCEYRDLPPHERSHATTVEITGKSISYIKKLSAEHDWVERAKAYDADRDEKARLLDLHHLKEGRKRRLADGQKLQRRAMKVIGNKNDSDITASEAIRMFEVGSKAEMQAVGDGPEGQKQGQAQQMNVNIDVGALVNVMKARLEQSGVIDVDGQEAG